MTLAAIILGVAVICCVVAANRFRRVDYTDIEVRDSDQPLARAGPDLSILTWNIGYGALGKDADFYVDGGTSLRALSKPQIITAAKAIAQRLAQTQCDLLCLQEMAQAGILTRNVDVRTIIDDLLPNRKRYFWADLKTVFLLRLSHGMATYSAKLSDHYHVLDLPDADTLMLGVIKKSYVGLITKLPITDTDKAWVIINIHLPIFNMTPAARTAQLDRLFDFAKKEFAKGNYVIIAGDWNTRLCPTSFPHTSDPKRGSDYTDFPQESLPAGWHIKADPKTPTVRALDATFSPGQTYTTIFDGFVVSPNVRVSSLKTLDLGFAHSDHQPVEASFSVGRM
ncbi:MAG: endonuclease/exonuclease/phosphatase family protein [Yoonia sp.]|jgi:endonuclease/exonuclease/phosphatase family metal-dependent hydrolase|uniref:endonuclease/exonuclease/phosphatase family protein n=1 Tax=Yoonia sp. TaxID=2212373 RepID=UPI00273D3622|nr:endonuclease/exonuclease/phosphatase family protein [Yoonia sp.]MDP5084364.1 endonuclease/exonuclease/phosphatase family protein [Yoonia sp.]